MAGQLIQVATETVTSAVASVTLTGIDSDDVYMVAVNNCIPETDNLPFLTRITKSGTADSTANYDYAFKELNAVSAFSNYGSANQTYVTYGYLGTAGSESFNGILYLYNFNSSSEYSFVTTETARRISNGNLYGYAGGYVHTVASASDGMQFYMSSGNIASGTFTLYKVV